MPNSNVTGGAGTSISSPPLDEEPPDEEELVLVEPPVEDVVVLVEPPVDDALVLVELLLPLDPVEELDPLVEVDVAGII